MNQLPPPGPLERLLANACPAHLSAGGRLSVVALDEPGHELLAALAGGPTAQPLSRWTHPEDRPALARTLAQIRDDSVTARALSLRVRTPGGGWQRLEALLLRETDNGDGGDLLLAPSTSARPSPALDELEALRCELTALRAELAAAQAGNIRLAREVAELRGSFEGTVRALSAAMARRDPHTAGHQERVAELAVVLGKELGLDDRALEGLRLAALLHDIGKIGIPSGILSRPGPMDEAQLAILRGHAPSGAEILERVRFPQPVAEIVRQHHERLDGSGYPDGLAGESIRPEARVLAVADVVEAMISHRPYRPALGIESALEEIDAGAGTRYDGRVAGACARLMRDGHFHWN